MWRLKIDQDQEETISGDLTESPDALRAPRSSANAGQPSPEISIVNERHVQ